MTDGCLVVVMDDDFSPNSTKSLQQTMRPSDVVAPWHLRSPGGGVPCNYLFVRGEPPLTEAKGAFIKWNTTAQAELLRRVASTPPAEDDLATPGGRSVKKSFMVPESLGADRSVLVSVDGSIEAEGSDSSQLLVVQLPAGLKAGDRFDVDVSVAPHAAPKTVSAEQLVAMAMEIVSSEPEHIAAVQGALALDPFQTHAMVRLRHGPQPHRPFFLPRHPCLVLLAVQVPVLVKTPRMKERALNKKMRKQANLLREQLRRINRLDAILVGRPTSGADWDDMEIQPGCCCCCVTSAEVVLPPFEQSFGQGQGSHGGSSKVVPQDASPAPSGLFIAGHLAVYMRCRTVPSQLSTISLSPSVDRNRDDVIDYRVSELARFGVVQSLSLESRCVALRHAMRAGATREDERTVRLVVLSLLGDCAVEMVKALDRPRPKKTTPAIDVVDMRTWNKLLQDEHELQLLIGTPHAQQLVSGLTAMTLAPGLSSWLQRRRKKDCAFFATLVKQVASTLSTAAEPSLLQKYAAELGAVKAKIAETSKQSVPSEQKGGLAFVVPDFTNLGAGALPANRLKRLSSELRRCSATAAVLWRFSSAGVAEHDALEGEGGHVIHVRDSAVLPSVEVVSGSKFATLTQQAHRKQKLGMRTPRPHPFSSLFPSLLL